MLRRFVSSAFALALLNCQPVFAQSWQTLAPLPNSLAFAAAGVVDNTVYVLSGLNGDGIATSVFAYAPGSNAWTTKASMLGAGRYGAAAAGANGVLYAFGGNGDEGGVQAYDPRTDTWSLKARMTPRANAGAAVANGLIYLVGGNDGTGAMVSSVDVYDPSTDTWTKKASMPTPRTMLAVAAINGIVYAVGGLGSVGNELEAYNPASDTWSKKAAMPTARQELTAAVLNGELYAIGGLTSDGMRSNVVEAYNPVTNTWASKPSMPTARSDIASAAGTDAIYVFGGMSAFGMLGTNEAYGSFGIQVTIDIKPGSSNNNINLGSAGVIPVAILSSATFDATQVDPATVTLMGSNVRLTGRGDKNGCNVRDVNRDGRPDLVCHIKTTTQSLLKAGSTSAVLTGRTFSGQNIQGEGSIRIVP
jgi:N-acetylneuraminic acid mutarotase